jgi:Tol biopolymer transport system component
LLAVLGLSLAAQAAHATTFPGTNGRVAGSGAIELFHPLSAANSKLELFTIRSVYSSPAAPPADECRLTNNGDSEFNPRFSKNGTKIVYVKNNSLWTMQLDAQGRCPAAPSGPLAEPGDPKPLTVGASDSFVGGWCTNASGQEWVVFQRSVPGLSFEVYKVQIDANRMPVPGTEMPLTLNPASDSQPAVRPDCSKIAFHSNRAVPSPPSNGGSASNIWVMNFDGSNQAPVTDGLRMESDSTKGSEESAPSWSPDGKKIAFQGDKDTQANQPRNLEIYRLDYGTNVTNTTVKRLSYSPSSAQPGESGFDVTGFDLNPAYSPNGKRICFHSGRGGHRDSNGSSINGQWDLYTLDAVKGEPVSPNPDASGSATEQLTNRPLNDERCGWQEAP